MQEKFRILEVNKFYAPHIGGIETLVQQRTRYFAQYPDVEVKVLVCQEQGEGETADMDGAEVIRCSSLGTWFSCPVSLAFFKKFRELSEWADVVEIHTPFPPGDLACLLSKCKCRVVIAWHSDVVRQKSFLWLYRPILQRFLRRADAVITATEGHINGSVYLPAVREKCHVIPYPLESEQYDRAKKYPILTEKLKDPYRLKLLFVGRFVYYKGIDVLLTAMYKVNGCELFLCGSGALETQLRRQAEGLPVHFLGRLSDEELKAAFADCDIFVLPSVENSEAFGIVQQEAMISGKPVINTSLPTGVPYVSIHGETGLTVPPGDANALADAIQTLADDPDMRRNFGKNARERALTKYNTEKIMQQILDVLRGNNKVSEE